MEMVKKHSFKNFIGLRGYAIILIVISHYSFWKSSTGKTLGKLGAIGVSLFIVLSGFLLYYNHQVGISGRMAYLKRKLLRFYPLHIFTMIVCIPIALKQFLNGDMLPVIAIPFNVLLLQAWIPIEKIYFSLNSPSWYLSITLLFISISPFVVNVINKISKKNSLIMGLILFEFFFTIVIDSVGLPSELAHWATYVFPAFRMIDFIAGGVLSSLIINKYTDGSRKNIMMKACATIIAIIFFIIIFIFFMCFETNDMHMFLSAVWIIPSLLLIGSIYNSDNNSLYKVLFQNRIIQFFGKYSFEIFLFHQVVNAYTFALISRIMIIDTTAKKIIIVVTNCVLTIILSMLWNKTIGKINMKGKDHKNEY